MKYTRLGSSGLVVSRVSLGMMSYGSPQWQPWVLPGDEAERFVRLALDAGVNCFDTADFYSHGASEEALGAAIRALCPRHEVVIATKVGLPMAPGPNRGGLSKKHILASLDASLQRLGTDYVDLYQLHRFDPDTPLDETLEALDIAVRSGRVLHVGATNFSTAQLAPAVLAHRWSGGPRFSSMQVQYNLAYREDERDLLPFCRGQGLGVMVYSPLARGFLTGNRRDQCSLSEREARRAASDLKAHQLYGDAGDQSVLDALLAVAAERELPPARIALAWLHTRREVDTVLCGALEPAHLHEAVAAVELELAPAELARLEGAYRAQPVKDDAFGAVQASGQSPV